MKDYKCNKKKGNKGYQKKDLSSSFISALLLLSLGSYQLVRPASFPSAMPEHHTRQVTTDKLEEAVKSLSQDNSTLNTKIDTIHASLTAKIEALFDRFASFTVNSPPPPPPTPLHASPAPHRHHMKLEVPRFDGHDPLGWIFKISQFF